MELEEANVVTCCGVVPARPALEGPVAVVTQGTLGHAGLVAFTLADEPEDDLHLLREAQWLDLDGLRLALLGTFVCRDADVEGHLGEYAQPSNVSVLADLHEAECAVAYRTTADAADCLLSVHSGNCFTEMQHISLRFKGPSKV